MTGLEIDPSFTQKAENQPKPDITEAGGIPLIDLRPLLDGGNNSGDAALETLVSEVESACSNWGFFQVINHGIPTKLLQRVQSAAREFFALRADEKRRVKRNEENFLGYYDTEYTKNVRDWKEVFDFAANEPMVVPVSGEPGETMVQEIWNRWPEYPSYMSFSISFDYIPTTWLVSRDACMEYSKSIEDLSYKLLELVAVTLKLPSKRLNSYFEGSISRIRLNHYPPCPFSDLALGVGPHKDQGALTVLAQDQVGGLDIRRKSDGQWVRVKPIENSYIVNIGDLLQVWSNDKYVSTEHRVSVNSEKERFSIPFFFYPAHYTMMKPLEELVTRDDPARYNEFNWGQFFRSRRSSNFRKLGVENIQISHFRKVE